MTKTSARVEEHRWDNVIGRCYQPTRMIGRLSYDTSDLCGEFLANCKQAFGSVFSTIWSVDPTRGQLILKVVKGRDRSRLEKPVLSSVENLSGVTIDRKLPTWFEDITKPGGCPKDVRTPDTKRRFGNPQIVTDLALKKMLSIPILNSSNPNQVLLVTNLAFCNDAEAPNEGQLLEIRKLAKMLANRFECLLQDRGIRFANRLEIETNDLPEPRTHRDSCKALARVVQRALGCDSVAVYLERHEEMKELQLLGAVGHVAHYDKTKNLSGGPSERCWKRNREHLSSDIATEEGIVASTIPGRLKEQLTAVFVPVRDFSGRARGVVRCTNRGLANGLLRPFTYEDVAIIEAICQAFTSQLEILLADQRRLDMLTRLAHEIRVPVAAFKAVLEAVKRELGTKRSNLLEYDHFQELDIYCEVMNRQMHELDIVRDPDAPIALMTSPTWLGKFIILPAKRFVEPRLRSKKLPTDAIIYDGIENIPEIEVDRALMTQVVFNLLENGIKYYCSSPNEFRIRIEATATAEQFQLVFQDWGIGIPCGWEERVFEAGIRAPNVYDVNVTGQGVTGQGIGLWFARKIVERHEGTLVVRRNSNPTELVITLPKALTCRPPTELSMEDE